MSTDYQIPKISENSGGIPCIEPKWTWMYAEFQGEYQWLMTPEISPFDCDLLFVVYYDGCWLYACTGFEKPVCLWSGSGFRSLLPGVALIADEFPEIAAKIRESTSTIDLWKAHDTKFAPKPPMMPFDK